MPSPIPAIDLIKSAMRLAGILESGETPNADETTDALATLNDVIEGWTAGTMAIWQTNNESFTTVAGQSTYTIGSGGDFNTTRPVRIESAYCTVSGVDFPIEIIDLIKYNLISLKTLQEQIVLQMVYLNDMPLGQIILWPVPSQAMPLVMSTSTSLTSIPTAATTITYPPAGARALRTSLAMALAAEYGVPVLPSLAAMHTEAIADYKRANKRKVEALYDMSLQSMPWISWQRGY